MNKQQLKQLRDRFMTEHRILCTGNPDREFTIASGIRKVFPQANFISLSGGWDLSGDLTEFQNLIPQYNVFINASRIENGCQLRLLNAAAEKLKYGHLFNVGSCTEYGSRSSDYSAAKLALHRRSIELYTYRLRTTHIVLGGLEDDLHPEWMPAERVANTIKWILQADFDVPVIGIEPEKDPW
jgi:hypothetical protein